MKVGFTGTQQGMTWYQLVALRGHLHLLGATELHHGDCVGADAEADEVAREMGLRTVSHPPADPKKRAFCASNEMREPELYLERNHDIVDETDVLIAAPRTDEEQLRSGTWSTVRYARKRGKDVVVLRR